MRSSAAHYGWISSLMGVIAMTFALLPLLTNSSTSISYVLCSVGITAVLLGLHAIRSRQAVAAGRIGVLIGTIATALMIAQALWFHFVVGGQAVLSPLDVDAPGSVDGAMGETPALDAGDFLASSQDAVRDALLSPAGMIVGFALLALVLCVGSVTILRWIGRTLRSAFDGRRRRASSSASTYRPSWERIDGTQVYSD